MPASCYMTSVKWATGAGGVRPSWIELFQDLVVVVMALSLFGGLKASWGTGWMLWYVAAIALLYVTWLTW